MTRELIGFGKGGRVPFAGLVDEWTETVAEDAAFFGCEKEVAHAHEIVAGGLSAAGQVAVFERAIAEGANHKEALVAVVDHLIDEIIKGCE